MFMEVDLEITRDSMASKSLPMGALKVTDSILFITD